MANDITKIIYHPLPLGHHTGIYKVDPRIPVDQYQVMTCLAVNPAEPVSRYSGIYRRVWAPVQRPSFKVEGLYLLDQRECALFVLETAQNPPLCPGWGDPGPGTLVVVWGQDMDAPFHFTLGAFYCATPKFGGLAGVDPPWPSLPRTGIKVRPVETVNLWERLTRDDF